MSEAKSQLPENLELLRVLTTGAAAEFCGFSAGGWSRLHREGKTPPAIKLSARKYGWRVRDLVAWQDSLTAQHAA